MASKAQELTPLTVNWPPRTDGGKPGPSDRQIAFFERGEKEQLYGGSKRGGKTVAGCVKAIYLSYLFPGNRGFMIRNTFTDLRDSTLNTFFKICPSELIISHNEQKKLIKLRTSNPKYHSEIIYTGIGEESENTARAKEKAKSKDSGWFWVDEPTEVNFEAYKMMLAQLCWYLPDGTRPPYMALLTSNPEPGWVKDRFIDPESAAYILDRSGANAVFVPSLPRDNPGLPPGWEDGLRATEDKDWIERYLDGSWDIHEGMVFTELSDTLHNLDHFIPADKWAEFHKGYRKVSSLDHASTGITAYVMCAVDRAENILALKEYYQEDKLIKEHAEKIKEVDQEYGPPEYRLIDPSCESATLQNRDEMISVQDAYNRCGISTAPAMRSKISVGLDLMKTMLRVNPLHIHPFSQQRGSSRLFISRSRCPNLWKEMVGLKKFEKPDGTIIYKGRDHACFVAGTLIDTPYGFKHIEDIRKGDLIYTHLGIGKADSDSAITGVKPVCSLMIQDALLYCTDDHKFITPGGVLRADELNGRLVWQRKSDTLMGYGSILGQRDIMRRPGLARRIVARCIRLYGNITTERFQKAYRSIISMALPTITGLRTCALSGNQNICGNIIPITSIKREKLQSNGIGLKLVESGTRSMGKKFRPISSQRSISVLGAIMNLRAARVEGISSVAMLISIMLDWLRALMILMLPARYVERISERIAIYARKLAPVDALESCQVKAGKALKSMPVYNFSSSHGTFYANSILSCNCDNVRYIVQSRPRAAEQERIDISTLPTVDQIAHRFHENWAKKFGNEGNTGSWF